MTPAPHIPLIAVLAVGAFVAWRTFRRFRRLIARQQFQPWRSWVSAVFFSFVVVVVLIMALHDPLRLAIAAGFAGLGIALGIYGVKRTVFEQSPAGAFYTPHAHIGVALSLLLVARILYRFAQSYYTGDGWFDPQSMEIGRSSLTLAIVATFAGYYATFAVGLIRRFVFPTSTSR